MKSQLLIILGISSTILGLYILIVSLMNIEQKADYHIGCYLSHQTNLNAFNFRTRLNQLTSKGDSSRNLHTKIKNTQLVDPHLNKKSVQLTQNVDSYIRNLALIKKYQQSNMEFFVELSNARQYYQNCAQDIRSTLDIDDSKQLWNQYKKCFDKYQTIKDNIDSLYSKRNKYLTEIDQLLVYDPATNRTFDLEEEINKIKERYDQQNAVNDKNKENYILELKRLQHKNTTKSSEHDENQRQYNRTNLEYQICLKNLKEFKKCQDIAKALRQYGYVESFDSLEVRIKSKRQMLVKLQELVIQCRQGGGDDKAIKQMYVKREKQLLQTLRLRLDMGYDEMKECGCTQEQRRKLEKDFESAKIKINLNKKELNELTYEIYTTEKKIKATDRHREDLINNFREETDKLKNRQTSNILTLQQTLSILKTNLAEVNGQLNDFSPKLNSLDFQCNQYKDRLALKLKDANTVTDCYGKKDFYDKLKSKAELILKKDDSTTLQALQKVILTLGSIFYPEKLTYNHTTMVRPTVLKLQNIPKSHEIVGELGQHKGREVSIDEELVQRVNEQQFHRVNQQHIHRVNEQQVQRVNEQHVHRVHEQHRREIIIKREQKITIQVKDL